MSDSDHFNAPSNDASGDDVSHQAHEWEHGVEHSVEHSGEHGVERSGEHRVEHSGQQSGETSEAHAPPTGRVLLKSFFALMVSLLGFYALAIAGQGLVTVLFFPDEMEALSADRSESSDAKSSESASSDAKTTGGGATETETSDTEEAASHDAPRQDFQPSNLYWSIGLLIYACSAFLSGTFLTRFAPMSPIGHSILLAALLFLHALQPNENAIFDRPAWVMAMFTFAIPSAVLVAAWMFAPRELGSLAIDSDGGASEPDDSSRRD